MIINTDMQNLTLRNWNIQDAEKYSLYANNYNIWKYFRDEFPFPFSVDDAVQWLKNTGIKNDKTFFAIDLNGEAIGDIHIHIHDDIRRLSGAVGYWLAEPFWNKGYMTECLEKFTEYCFHELRLVRVYAKLFSTNIASARALKKAGNIREGILKKAVIKEDKIIDQYIFANVK